MTTKDEIIEITANDGKVTKCELFDMVEFNGKLYSLLVEEGHSEDAEPELIIMKYREIGEDVYFEQITDQTEFKDVSEYVESLPGSEE